MRQNVSHRVLHEPIKNLSISDRIIEWEHYSGDFDIPLMFSLDDWHKIVYDIDSGQQWKSFLSDYRDYVSCYILHQCSNNKPIAFCFIQQEDSKGKIVSIHGGGWEKSSSKTLLYYRGFISIIDYLLNNNYKVQTACMIDNAVAYRFIRSVGFVKYRQTPTRYLLWINQSRLHKSKIYQFLHRPKFN